MRILFAVHHLENYAGSEVMTLELVRCAKDLGMDVEVASFYLSETLSDRFQEIGVDPLDLVLDAEVLRNAAFDVAWLCHYPIVDYVAAVLEVRASRWIRAVLSPFEPLEALSGLEREFDLVVANSEETAQVVCQTLDKSRVQVFANSAPHAFFQVPPIEGVSLRRLLLVSNHVPEEVRGAVSDLTDAGVVVREIGLGGEQKLVAPDDIMGADAVVTIGKTVQYAMAAGRPVFCYDRFGGPGWLSGANVAAAARLNFSGRGFDRLGRAQLASAIIDGYAQARLEVDAMRALASDSFSLERNFLGVLDRENPAQPRRIGGGEFARRGESYAALVSAHRHTRNLCTEQSESAAALAAEVAILQAELGSTVASAEEERASSQAMLAEASRFAESLQAHLAQKEAEIRELSKIAETESGSRSDIEQRIIASDALVDTLRVQIEKITALADDERRRSQEGFAEAAESERALRAHIAHKESEVRDLAEILSGELERRAHLERDLEILADECEKQRAEILSIAESASLERMQARTLLAEREEAVRSLEHRLREERSARQAAESEADELRKKSDAARARYESEKEALLGRIAAIHEKHERADKRLALIDKRFKYLPLLLYGIESSKQEEKGK